MFCIIRYFFSFFLDKRTLFHFRINDLLFGFRINEPRIIFGLATQSRFRIKGVLHLLPKISMFCALSQNNQQLFEK